MEFKEWYRDSTSEEGKLYTYCYLCEHPKAIVQIVHGMAEHSKRYDEFAKMLSELGYIVCSSDLLGHGLSSMDHLGAFALKENGFQFVLKDIHNLFVEIGESYPELPLILMGHSMGSILSGMFADQYDYLSALILMGMPAQNKGSHILERILKRNVKRKGYTYESKLINQMMWGPVEHTLEGKRKRHDWLSYNPDNIERYLEDPYCSFPMTDSGNLELVKGLNSIGRANWGKRILDIPILIIAGKDDKVGNFGEGPKYYYEKLHRDHSMVTLKLIENNRHEILHESSKYRTYDYIFQWINATL